MQKTKLTRFYKIFSRQNKAILGTLIMLFSLALLFAFVSFFFTWQEDQSTISDFKNREIEVQNWLSKFGANISHFFIYKGFGISGLIFPYLFFYFGRYLFVEDSLSRLINRWFWGVFVALWFSMLLSLLFSQNSLIGGAIGYEVNDFLYDYIGKIGLTLVLIFGVGVYIFSKMKVSPEVFIAYFKKIVPKDKTQEVKEYLEEDNLTNDEIIEEVQDENYEEDDEEIIENNNDIQHDLEIGQNEMKTSINQEEVSLEFVVEKQEEEEVSIEVNTPISEEELSKNLSDKLVESHGEFDPTLELSEYKFPQLDLLVDHGPGNISVDENELEENKNNIVRTLQSYKVEISSIKATIGPTVTLYEIVPASGVRISKIKNLEDDIALSLAALGIRVIAPMPGKGTVGIEVPNKNPVTVSMRSAIASKKFQSSDMALPIALGKTITNETFVVDLSKMPHLLMAGATGQGKSVGLNAILTSLLYKRHPAEVKFVLVDPKKVELTLFSKIERHFLAKLPDSEDAIITDNSKVINTLNSLCIEMDDRYELLKEAQVRNIEEYNQRFKKRKLNPENGHRFLPYIVLVVDEFADLIMTAGKEVETPIARLAQLARAIGIHLIIATQRPSVNVITGTIKANFPARIAFRVTSGIDSKTILDSQGANQLIGRGDLLYTQGNDLIRVQCAFVDTPEVEEITSFIGAQRAYPEAYLLPEYVGEESSMVGDIDASDRDKLFRDAAEVIVVAQQGSTSLIQRKLKLGYNRAGRIIDQLEAAGIVGPFEGSKARQVLIKDLVELDKILDDEII